MSNHYFYLYDSTKWDWTVQATKKFMNGFKRFDTNFEQKEQVYVGVYGPTQVGKTTFILTLLGISPLYLNEIADKLRGGREKGKSATITCTIFERSSNHEFHIIWPTGEAFQCVHLDEVEKIMGNLRRKIYKNQSFSLEPLTIKVPSRFFNQQDVDTRIRDLSIIDLPGDDSKDSLEMLHVDKILKEYIARCKVCIIMEISSQMTALTKLDKEIVRDWQELPEQFRIVLTRSISNDSVMEKIDKGEIQSTAQLKAEYDYELGRVCENSPLQTRIYPLEFGDSWTDLKGRFPNVFSNAAVWVEELFSDLVDDLTRINSPEQEIKKLKSMERYIEKHQKEELEKLEILQQIATAEFSQQTIDVALYVKQLTKELKMLKDMQAFEKKWANRSYKLEYTASLPSWSNLQLYEKKSSYLKARYFGELEDLKDAATEIVNRLNDVAKESNRFQHNALRQFDLDESCFDRNLTLDYLVDRYFFESRYSEDREKALTQLKACVSHFDSWINSCIAENTRQIQDTIKQHQKICRLKQQDLKRLIETSINKVIEIEKNALDIQLANEEWTLDKERASQLDSFLMESYVTHANRLKQKLFDPKTELVEKWFVHFYWNVMKEQAKGLITNE
ncbi:hypothetical protein ACQKNC_10340 [Lysinibacillus sp. NPDC094177]|uniref:hypothetical protein n=1 Tax=Lysinibacillus sp. NPDC094177 TaxID=3390580 RepID=UPI003D06C903